MSPPLPVLSGVQYVPGDAGGLHPGAQGGPAGLALRAAHSAAEEDGGRPAGLGPGQSPEGAGHHKVCGAGARLTGRRGGQQAVEFQWVKGAFHTI